MEVFRLSIRQLYIHNSLLLLSKRQHSMKASRCFTQLRLLSSESSSESDSSDGSSSSDDESSHNKEDLVKERVLKSSLAFVLKLGWSRKALAAGAEAEGLPGVAHGLFPRGGIELVDHLYVTSNRSLATLLAKDAAEGKNKKIGVFVKAAVQTRMRMIIPFIETWPQAIGLMMLPQNVIIGCRNLNQLVDDIWFYAGDESTNMTWYTKRASLAALYESSVLFMLQDRSEDFQDTWSFVDRRTADLAQFGKAVKNVQEGYSFFGDVLYGAYAMGRNLFGINDRYR